VAQQHNWTVEFSLIGCRDTIKTASTSCDTVFRQCTNNALHLKNTKMAMAVRTKETAMFGSFAAQATSKTTEKKFLEKAKCGFPP